MQRELKFPLEFVCVCACACVCVCFGGGADGKTIYEIACACIISVK